MKNLIVSLNNILYNAGFFNFMPYIKGGSIHCYFFDDTVNPFLSINIKTSELKVSPLYINDIENYYDDIVSLLKQYK